MLGVDDEDDATWLAKHLKKEHGVDAQPGATTEALWRTHRLTHERERESRKK